MGVDLVVRLVIVITALIDIALACAWRVGYRRRQLDDLTRHLDDDDADARVRAAEGLVRLGLDRAAPSLLAHVEHEDDDTEARVRAAEGLVRLGLDRAAPPLLAHIQHEDDALVRTAVAIAVARRQWEPAAAPGVADLRSWAATELDAHGTPVEGFGPALTRLADMGGPRRPDDGPRPKQEQEVTS